MGKGFSDFTYGVGLEINAQSFKQVKDDLKLNFNTLSKMLKSYEKVLKIDPDVDLSKLFDEMRKIKSIVDGINQSDNSLTGFVDKGTVSSIASLEERLKTIDSTSNNVKVQLDELKNVIGTLLDPFKEIAKVQFPATFDNLFGDVSDQTSKIKEVRDQIDKLETSIKELENSKAEFQNSTDSELDNSTTSMQVKSWINEFKELKKQLSNGSANFDLHELETNVLRLSELGTKINQAFGTFDEGTMKDLGFPLEGKEGKALNNFLLSIPKQIDDVIQQIEVKRMELSAQLEQLHADQSKYTTGTSQKRSRGQSLGLQSDYTAQVKVTPKANDAEWANILNTTIRNIEGQLHKVHLTPTFSKSKDISKEMEGNLAQINHAINVELKVDDNIEKFEERINNIDTSIKNAKDRLEKNGNFKIKFEYEEGGNFKDVAYKIINQLKQVEVHVDKSSTNTFLKEIGDLRTRANKELKNIKANIKFNSFNSLMKSVDTLKAGIDSKLGKSDIILNISNEPEVIAQATLIRDKLISLFGNVPINLGVNAVSPVAVTNVSNNNVEQLSEAAQEAQQKLEKCRQTLSSLQELGFNSPHFLELGDITPDGKKSKESTKNLEDLLNRYKELQAKLPADVADRWQELYPEANGNKSIARRLAQEVQAELKKVEAELKPYLQKQIAYTQSRYDYYDKIIQQEKELASVQKSNADNEAKSVDSERIKKTKDELTSVNNLLKDLQVNGFKSSEFLNLGDIGADGNKIEESTKKIKRLLTEYENLKKRTTKEKGAGSEQWSKKYPKANGDMAKVQKLIEKDEKRMQKIELELNQYAQKQIAFLNSRKTALQQVLSTEEQITSESVKQSQADKSDVSTVNTNQQLAMSAEEAAEKVKSLSKTLKDQKKVLKDLDENGINSKSLIKLGEWDKKTGSFKQNRQEMQQLVNKYNELKAAREKAGVKKAVGEERSLRGKLSSILRQQKQHASEIVAQNQAELKTAKEISAAYKEADVAKKKSTTNEKQVDINSTEQKIEQITQKLTRAKNALSSLQSGLGAVASTKLGDNKGVLKDAGRTETLKQLVTLYGQLTSKKKEFETSGISNQSIPEMQALLDTLSKAKNVLDKKGLFGLSETGLGDVKGRLSGSSQDLNELVSQYRELLTVKQQLEKSGDTTSETYTSTINAVKGIEDQLKILRQDQFQEIGSKMQGLEAEIAKKTEYLNIVKECSNIESILADVHKNQVDYATARIDLYTQQLTKEQELLQVAKQRAQEDAKNVERQNVANDQQVSATANTSTTSQATSTVQLDSATLSSLAKDSTLQSIDGKIGSILSSLGGNIKISGSNIVIEASNVSVSGKTSGTSDGPKKTSTSKKTNTNQGLAASAEQATQQQKELNAELKETQQLSDMALSQTTEVINETKKEVKKLTETYRSPDKISERTEVSGWVNHGKDEPPTFEHVSTVYKTNMDAYNKMRQDYVKSLSKQMELQAKIKADDGSTSKMQAELSIQKEITNQLELQLQRHSDIFTEQAKQEATLEAAKKAQQEIEKSEGAKKDRDINKQNRELAKIVDGAQNKFNEMQYGMQSSKVPMADEAINRLKQYEQLLSTLKLKQQELLESPDLLKDEDYSNSFSSLLQQMDAVETEFTELQKSSTAFLSKMSSEDIKPLGSSFNPNNLEQMHDAMQEFADQASLGAAKLIEFNDAERSATFEVHDGHDRIQQLTVAYDAATNSLGRYTSKTRESTSETKKFLNSLKHSFQNVARYIASFGSVYELFAVIKQGVTYVREIDSALTELKKVTDETDASYANFLQNMSVVGKTVGATVKDLTTMAAEWARLGYSMEESGQLAQSTAILMNVSEFDDATKASEALISTMQAFQYTADESGHVVDILNEVGNNYAVSSDGIATALQDSASALMEGGNNLEQAVALVAAANRVVQDPNSVGSALRTISLRLRGTSVEILEEMGEETDGVVESTSKLQEKIQALSGVDILTNTGDYKDTYTILKEIGTVWEEMSDIDQAALLELMAGKNRANTLSAILSNMEDLEGAYESAMNAEGSALKENEAYLNSIQGRIDLFNNSVQTMWMNTISSDLVKGFVDFGTSLIGLIDKLGLFKSLIAGIFTYFTTFSKNKIDLASMLGIHDLDAGWFNKKVKIQKTDDITQAILGDSNDIKKSVENFADNIRTNINDYITIDTTQIDSQIKSVQDRLDILRPQLDYAVKHKKELWYKYKDAGSKTPAKDRDDSITKQREEIKVLEQDLIRLQQQRDNIVTTAIDNTLTSKVQEYKSMLSVLDQVKDKKLYLGSEQDAAAKIDAMSAAAQKGQVDLTNYVSALSDTDIALKAYAASVQDGNYSLAGFQQFIAQHNAGLKASGAAAKLAAVRHQLLNTALSMGISMIASFAISSIISGINYIVQAEERAIEAAQKAADASKELQDKNASLDNYKQQINELRTALDNNTLSETEAYNARANLLSIESELASKFGLEAEGIDLVTGAIENQIAAIDKLSQKDAQKWLNENQKAINGAIEYFDSDTKGGLLDPWYEGLGTRIDMWGQTQNVIDMIDEYASQHDNIFTNQGALIPGDQSISFTGSVEEVKQAVEDFGIWLDHKEGELLEKKTDLLSLPDQTDEVKAQISSIEKDIEQLKDVREDIGAEFSNWFGENSTYKANKDLLEQTQYNTALTKYTDEYMRVLEAENALIEAQKKGDKEGIASALETLNAETESAAAVAKKNGQNYMVNFFDGISGKYEQLSNELNLENTLLKDADVKKNLTDILFGFDGKNAKEILQIGEIDPNDSSFVALDQFAQQYNMTINELINSLIKLGYVQAGFDTNNQEKYIKTKAYSTLVSDVESYNEAVSQTSDIVSDNIVVTQEYKDSLIALGISESELNKYFHDDNNLVVKNAQGLNNLVKSTKQNVAQNIKLAKAQARLEYYDLYKEMKNLTNETETVDEATLAYIDSLYENMNALTQVISKYSLLETELLGAANAYQKLADAKAADEASDYGSKAEELVNVLGSAFHTGEIGTQAAKVAIEGLIPDGVIDRAATLDEQIQQIYGYFTTGKIPELFTIEFDDEGAISSVEMTKENVKNFAESLMGDGPDSIFKGNWDEFTLNPAIKTLEDFANACNITEEVAFAFLTELEKYDIGNALGNGDSLLDQLMGDNLDYQLQKALEKAAEVEKKLAEGKISSTDQEYVDAQNNLTKVQKQALENSLLWAENQTALEEQKQLLSDYQTEYANLLETNGDTSEVEANIKEVNNNIDKLIKNLHELDTPTEFTLEVAMDEAQDKIDDFKNEIDGLVKTGDSQAIKVKAIVDDIDTVGFENLESLGFTKNASGVWEGTAEIVGWSELDSNSQSKVLDYINLIESQHVIDALMGEGITTVEEHLRNIADILQKTYELQVESNVDKSAVDDFISWLSNTSITKTVSFFAQKVGGLWNSIFGGGESAGGSGSGANRVNGTANAGGNWGAPRTETSLVGELGPEIIVRGNKWTTVGDNGAEFTQVKKGDIIFNHKQTESLLKNGFVTGRGKMHGGAFASGTAYALTMGTNAKEDKELKELTTKILNEFTGVDVGYSSVKRLDDTYYNATGKHTGIIDTIEPTINLKNDYKNPSTGGGNGGGGGSSNAEEEADEIFDWIEVRLEEIEEDLNLLSAKLENASSYSEKNNVIDEIIDTHEVQMTNLKDGIAEYTSYASKLLAKVPEEYRDKVQDGAIAIEEFASEADEKTLEAIENYREWAQKVADLEEQLEGVKTEIRDLAMQKFDNIYEAGEVRITVEDSQTEKLQSAVDLIEESGNIAAEAYYTAMMENSNKTIEYMTNTRNEMQKVFDEAVEAGIIVRGSNEWYEMVDQLYQVDAEIAEATSELEEFQNAINDLYWDNFDQLINRIDYLSNETKNLIELMDSEDMVVDPVKRKYENGTVEYWTADDVQWSEEGLASLGLYAQQMEIAEYKSKQYAEAIDDLTKEYEAGHYSENEYYEKLNELKDAQYESIEAYYDAQDAIKDLNATRIDSIKKGIEKEIEAYEELIEAKKELLDSEKDAYDFQKNVMKQQKEISDIERKLSALAYDNSISAAAKRAQLEAELSELKSALDETYYDRSVEEQKNALDKELENFQKEKDDEVIKMEEYLEDIKQVVADSLIVVQDNATGIYDTLTGKAEEYNLTLSESILTPWQDGSLAVSDYQETFDTAMSSTMDQLDALKNKWQEVIDKMTEAGNVNVDVINKENANYAAATPASTDSDKQEKSADSSKYNTYTVQSGDNLWAIAEKQLGAGSRWQEIYNLNKDIISSPDVIQPGWNLKIPKYAKGTTGTSKDQWAILDELGEELELIPDGNGRLAYMKKGTGVIPADLTANLMEWGKLDPSTMLDQNKPEIGVSPSVVNNTTEIHIDASVGELLHVEHLEGNNPAEISKIVDKAWDKRMKELNGYIRRYTNR